MLHHLLLVWPSANYITSLHPDFLEAKCHHLAESLWWLNEWFKRTQSLRHSRTCTSGPFPNIQSPLFYKIKTIGIRKAENVFIRALFAERQMHANWFVLQFISHKILVGFLRTAGYELRCDNDYLINVISCPGQPVAYAHSWLCQNSFAN